MSEMKPFQANITGAGYGYGYVMSYPHSDKVKIGHSLNPTTRAADIGGTLAPEQPLVEAYYWCSERREDVERKAHALEDRHRHNGEWFVLTVTAAMAAINKAAEQVSVQIQLVFDREEHELAMKREQEENQTRWASLTADELLEELRKEEGKDSVFDMMFNISEKKTPHSDLRIAYEKKSAEELKARSAAEKVKNEALKEKLRTMTHAELQQFKQEQGHVPYEVYREWKRLVFDRAYSERQPSVVAARHTNQHPPAPNVEQRPTNNKLVAWLALPVILMFVGLIKFFSSLARLDGSSDGITFFIWGVVFAAYATWKWRQSVKAYDEKKRRGE